MSVIVPLGKNKQRALTREREQVPVSRSSSALGKTTRLTSRDMMLSAGRLSLPGFLSPAETVLADPVLVVVGVADPGQCEEFQEPAHVVLITGCFEVPVDALNVGDHESLGFAFGQHPFSTDVAVSADDFKEYLVLGNSRENEGC